MSLFDLSDTLTWQSTSDSGVSRVGARQRKSSSPVVRKKSACSSTSASSPPPPPPQPASRVDGGDQEYDVGSYGEYLFFDDEENHNTATPQPPRDASVPSSVSEFNTTQTGLLYALVTSPDAADLDVYGGNGTGELVKGRSCSSGAEAKKMRSSSPTGHEKNNNNNNNNSVGCGGGGGVYSTAGCTISSMQLLSDVVKGKSCTPGPVDVDAEDDLGDEVDDHAYFGLTPPSSKKKLFANMNAATFPSRSSSKDDQRTRRGEVNSTENSHSSNDLAAPETQPASSALQWRVGVTPLPIIRTTTAAEFLQAPPRPPTSRSSGGAPPATASATTAALLDSIDNFGEGEYYLLTPLLDAAVTPCTPPTAHARRMMPDTTTTQTAQKEKEEEEETDDEDELRLTLHDFPASVTAQRQSTLPPPESTSTVHVLRPANLPWPSPPQNPPVRPATCPAARHVFLQRSSTHKDAKSSNTAAVVPVARTPPVFDSMTPLQGVHGTRTGPLRHGVLVSNDNVAATTTAGVQSSMRTVNIPFPPALAHFGKDDDIVPTVIASQGALRLHRTASSASHNPRSQNSLTRRAGSSLSGTQAKKAVHVSVLRTSVIESAPQVHRGLSRHDSAVPSNVQLSRVGSDLSATTVNVQVPAAVFEAMMCEPTLPGYPPLSQHARGRKASQGSLPSGSSVGPRTVVVKNPFELREKDLTTPAEFQQQQQQHRVQVLPRHVSQPSATSRLAPPPQTQTRHCALEKNHAPKVNLRDLTADIGREYDLMTASLAELLSTSPVSTQTLDSVVSPPPPPLSEGAALLLPAPVYTLDEKLAELKRAGVQYGFGTDEDAFTVSSEAADADTSAAEVGAPTATDNSSSAAAAAPALVKKTQSGSSVALSERSSMPFEAPMLRMPGNATATPAYKRYPSHITPVSSPRMSLNRPLPPRRTSGKAAAPVVTDTAPTPSKKFIQRSKLASTRLWIGQAPMCPMPRMTTAAELERARQHAPQKPKQASPLPLPATAGLTPPSAAVAADDDQLIPLVREREPERPTHLRHNTHNNNSNTNNTLNCQKNATNHKMVGRTAVARRSNPKPPQPSAAAVVKNASNPVLPPLNALQLAMLPSDDLSVLQTPRNDSTYEPSQPSQASPEWRDVPIPVLRRSLIAQIAPELANGDNGGSSVLTVHPRHRESRK